MKTKTTLGLATLVPLTLIHTASAAIIAGFDQRYAASDYGATTAGVWDDSAGSANATAVGTFGTTTTANGSIAIVNTGAGEQMNFTGGASLGGSGFTIQAVIRIDDNADRRQGPLGLDQSAGWGGLFMGARSNGNVETRAGTQTSGSNAGLLSTNTTPTITPGTWGILTMIADTSLGSPLTYSFDLLSDGSNVFTYTDAGNGTTNAIAGIGTAGRLFGGETGSGEPDTDAWLGAIADLVIYDTVLTSGQLAANKAEFTTLYQVPEPSSALLLGLGGLGLILRRRRNA
jgi:hypothetical protein